MILLHLFCSAVPRSLDTPRIRLVVRAACVLVFALVLAGAVSRGDTPAEAPAPDAAAIEGRGNVSIVHLPGGATEAGAPAETSAEARAASSPGSDAAATSDSPETSEPAQAESHAQEVAPASADEAHAPAPAPPLAADGPVPSGPEAALPLPEHAPVESDVPHLAGPDTHPPRAPVMHAAFGRPGIVEDFAESGRRFWQAGEHAAAEKAFTRALTANVPVEQKRDLVLEMAALYRGANQLSKAAAVLEKFIKTYPDDREVPQVLLQLGTVYRELGVYSMATARFFQVLNSTLRVSDEDIPEYRRLAMKARLEIAETYAMQGNLTEAEKYFARLQLLELEPADRERVLLRGAQMQYTLKQWLGAEKALAAFAANSPDSPHLPEVRYMRARALEELGRKQEAVDEVVALLQMPADGDAETARAAAFWKRRCANELANRFYEQGDFLGALAIYQALARASIEPSWRWPAIYQIGLCFERMDMPQRAAEAYDAILGTADATAEKATLPETLASLQDMARWRRSHLVWIEQKGEQLDSLAGGEPAS